ALKRISPIGWKLQLRKAAFLKGKSSGISWKGPKQRKADHLCGLPESSKALVTYRSVRDFRNDERHCGYRLYRCFSKSQRYTSQVGNWFGRTDIGTTAHLRCCFSRSRVSCAGLRAGAELDAGRTTAFSLQ